MTAQLGEVDTLLFGRVTYEHMAAYWPTPAAEQNDPAITATMNSIPKLVVSRTLATAEWANTRLVSGDAAGVLAALKEQSGKDIAIFGSSNLTASLLQLGLVDELRIMISPIVLGGGRSLLRTADKRIGMCLVKTRAFRSGNVLLHYRPDSSPVAALTS